MGLGDEKQFAHELGDGTEEYAEKAAVERCPRCGHQPHQQPCLNMASDNDCDCPGDAPPEPSADPALELAHIIDPDAFEDHPIERRRQAAAVQWSARRYIARLHAERILASDWLAAHTAAAEARGAQAVLDAVEDVDPWPMQTTARVMLAAAREAARNAGTR